MNEGERRELAAKALTTPLLEADHALEVLADELEEHGELADVSLVPPLGYSQPLFEYFGKVVRVDGQRETFSVSRRSPVANQLDEAFGIKLKRPREDQLWRAVQWARSELGVYRRARVLTKAEAISAARREGVALSRLRQGVMNRLIELNGSYGSEEPLAGFIVRTQREPGTATQVLTALDAALRGAHVEVPAYAPDGEMFMARRWVDAFRDEIMLHVPGSEVAHYRDLDEVRDVLNHVRIRIAPMNASLMGVRFDHVLLGSALFP